MRVEEDMFEKVVGESVEETLRDDQVPVNFVTGVCVCACASVSGSTSGYGLAGITRFFDVVMGVFFCVLPAPTSAQASKWPVGGQRYQKHALLGSILGSLRDTRACHGTG